MQMQPWVFARVAQLEPETVYSGSGSNTEREYANSLTFPRWLGGLQNYIADLDIVHSRYGMHLVRMY